MVVYNSIEEWNLETSDFRKNISRNMIDMRTGGDPNILLNSKRTDEVTGGVRFTIDLSKLNGNTLYNIKKDYNEVVH